jgi:hypothetical protein
MSTQPATTPKRKRGGQPRNHNARTHGFYERTFTNLEVQDLDTLQVSIADEIALLRVATRRLTEYTRHEDHNIETAIAILNAHGNATIRIASLLKTQRLLSTDNGAGAVLAQALADVIKEFGLT